MLTVMVLAGISPGISVDIPTPKITDPGVTRPSLTRATGLGFASTSLLGSEPNEPARL